MNIIILLYKAVTRLLRKSWQKNEIIWLTPTRLVYASYSTYHNLAMLSASVEVELMCIILRNLFRLLFDFSTYLYYFCYRICVFKFE